MTFFPRDAPVPVEKRTDRLFLRPLRATDAERDYDAVMSSAGMLRTWSQSDWPSDDFTLAENLDDLKRHEREHEERVAFTYTVLDPAGTRCLGCVYLTPVAPQAQAVCEGAGRAVNAGFWVRASELPGGLERHLFDCLRAWLKTEWGFDCVVFAVSGQERRQAALLAESGLLLRATWTMEDGRTRCAYR